MKRLRQLGIWGAVAAVGLLAALSVAGAFLGAERAERFFNATPLVVFWFLLGGLLVVGFVAFRSLLARPGLLAMHLGALLVLGGAMWGSDRGHALGGGQAVPSAYMVIHEGETTDVLLDPATQEAVGRLPFPLRLDDFRLEYYKPDDPARWDLSVGTLAHREEALQPWRVGSTFTLPVTGIRVRVLGYLASSRPVLDDRGNVAAAECDPDGKGPPAMQVLIASHGAEDRAWLVPREGEGYAELLLAGRSRGRGALRGGDYVMAQSLILERPEPPIRDYLSDVAVVRDNLDVAKKTVEVNDPLHWGGYHFYQVDYDHEAARYTVLLVQSDRGLYVVYGGFILLVAGAFWHFWIAPALRFVAARQGGRA